MEALARTGEAIRATSSKLEKTRLLGEYFAGVDEEALGASYMRHSDVGDVIEEVLEGHTHPRPTSLRDVHETFVRIYEQRTVKKKTEALRELLDRLTPREAKYVGKILTGDLRIGLRAGLVEEGIA